MYSEKNSSKIQGLEICFILCIENCVLENILTNSVANKMSVPVIIETQGFRQDW